MTKAQVKNLKKANDDICWYVENVLGVNKGNLDSQYLEAYESYQKRILRAIQKYPKVAVRAGHGVGKTTIAAWASNWFFDTRYESKTITTASAWRQVSKVLWPEIHKWRKRAQLDLIGGQNYEPLNLMLKRGEDWFATGEASNEPDKMEGFHAENLFYIVDEGKSVPDATYESIEGALTTENTKMLVISTPPSDKSGYFYDIFSRRRIGFKLFHVKSTESPIVSKAWVEQRKEEWGESSPVYQTRVLGEFSESSEDTIITLKWVEQCIDIDVPEGGEKCIGVDVARFGDDETVFILRHGQNVLKIERHNQQDTMETVGKINNLAQQYGVTKINVDDIGVGGGVVDRLSELVDNEKIAINGINVAQSARDPEKFQNIRAEMYWGLRLRFKDGAISIPNDEVLIGQLTNIKYKYNSRGQIYIEDKNSIKKRGLKSPDIADALALSYIPTVSEDEVTFEFL